MTITKRGALIVVMLVASCAFVYAQGRPRQGGGQGPRGARNYNPATETTFTGTVEQVINTPAPGNGPGGVHLAVKTSSGVTEVHLGPAWYMSSQHIAFDAGDTITVTGSKVPMNGTEVVIAREIKKGEQVLTLRNPQGIPNWAGRGRRGR